MQYDAKANELKNWMSQMQTAFGDTNHGQELEEIKSRLTKFAQYRRGEKPERREQLTEVAGHLNTLNASCRNNNRPIYEPPDGESIPELETDWDTMQAQEAAYQTSLQDAYTLFQRLEATLNSFNGGADQANTFCSDTQAKIDQIQSELSTGKENHSLTVNDVEGKVSQNQDIASQIDTRIVALQAMTPLVADLRKGGHRQAEHCQQRLDELAETLGNLSTSNGGVRSELELELERQRHLTESVPPPQHPLPTAIPFKRCFKAG